MGMSHNTFTQLRRELGIALFDAVFYNTADEQTVNDLINAGADPNIFDEDTDNSTLHWAVHFRRQKTIASLLKCGADPNFTNKKNKTPLISASENNDWESTVTLITCESLVKHTKTQLGAALWDAVRTYSPPSRVAAHSLLEADANPNRSFSVNGYTSYTLHHAVLHADKDLIKMLLMKEADPLLQDSNGRTPLSKASDERNQRGTQAFAQAYREVKECHQNRLSWVVFQQCITSKLATSHTRSSTEEHELVSLNKSDKKDEEKIETQSSLAKLAVSHRDEPSTKIDGRRPPAPPPCQDVQAIIQSYLFDPKVLPMPKGGVRAYVKSCLERQKELKKEPDSKDKVARFKKIYNALRDGQNGFFKTNFLAKKGNLASSDLTNEIENYIKTNPNSRTAKAWALAGQHRTWNNDNIPINLFSEIYQWAFEKSGTFKMSNLLGTIFLRSISLNAEIQRGELTQVKISSNIKNDSSRSACIYKALRKC